jgi:hypothetical protein
VIGRLVALGLLLSSCVACATTSSGPAASDSTDFSAVAASSSGPTQVQLTVRVGLFGGPMRLDGTMADVNAPAQGIAITITGAGSMTLHQATGPDGTAVFHVAPGRWTVRSSCGNPQTLDVARSTVTSVQCDVP